MGIFKSYQPKIFQKELEETNSLLEGIFIEIRKDKTCITSFVLDIEGTWTLDLEEKILLLKMKRCCKMENTFVNQK